MIVSNENRALNKVLKTGKRTSKSRNPALPNLRFDYSLSNIFYCLLVTALAIQLRLIVSSTVIYNYSVCTILAMKGSLCLESTNYTYSTNYPYAYNCSHSREDTKWFMTVDESDNTSALSAISTSGMITYTCATATSFHEVVFNMCSNSDSQKWIVTKNGFQSYSNSSLCWELSYDNKLRLSSCSNATDPPLNQQFYKTCLSSSTKGKVLPGSNYYFMPDDDNEEHARMFQEDRRLSLHLGIGLAVCGFMLIIMIIYNIVLCCRRKRIKKSVPPLEVSANHEEDQNRCTAASSVDCQILDCIVHLRNDRHLFLKCQDGVVTLS